MMEDGDINQGRILSHSIFSHLWSITPGMYRCDSAPFLAVHHKLYMKMDDAAPLPPSTQKRSQNILNSNATILSLWGQSVQQRTLGGASVSRALDQSSGFSVELSGRTRRRRLQTEHP
ncbi:unnamed protein product [Pleuronectes platessa]|uniref:Uncharacterized protein n=1 Tax=Pleuronectes platessa TaxID=8262 RepID=A0A9N7TRE6_PLEPL|nr:unnamed protein product [Pleuronectes platessa]